MMTPVYNVATACLSPNTCGVSQYAGRSFPSAFPINKSPEKEHFHSISKLFLPLCLHYLKRYSVQGFHFILGEPSKYYQRIKSPTRNNSLRPDISPKHDGSIKYSEYLFCNSEVNPITHCDFVKSGTDVLWQKVKFKLEIRTSENNRLRGYIKEQPADDTTTATDEEK